MPSFGGLASLYNGALTIKPKLTLGQETLFNCYWTYKLRDNVKIIYNEEMNFSRLVNPKKNLSFYKYGVMFEWTI